MKVLYLIDQPIEGGKTSGIIHKIKSKISRWQSLKTDVQLLSLYNFKRYDRQLNLIDETNSFEIKKHHKIITLIRLTYSAYLLCRHLKDLDFDIIYMRTRLWTPFIRWALKGNKVIMEINSNDITEARSLSKVFFLYHRLTRNCFYSLASGFVCVSKELQTIVEEFKKPTLILANGVNPDEYLFKESPNNSRPQVCFIGSPDFPWHGIEHILWLAKELKNYDFHIIGEEGEQNENIFYHGYLNQEDSQKFIANCDVAISTLALYKKSMEEASPLKSRQYMAQGIPFIYAYKDTDLQKDLGFCLRLENTPNGVKESLPEIQSFILKAYQNKEMRNQVRQFAIDELSIERKEKSRIEFLKNQV